MALRTIRGPGDLWRIDHTVDVADFPPAPAALAAGKETIGGNRWVDAYGRFATVECYPATQSAFEASIAHFQVAPRSGGGWSLHKALRSLTHYPTVDRDLPSPGMVPESYFEQKSELTLNTIALSFFDLTDSETQETVVRAIAPAIHRPVSQGTTDLLDPQDRAAAAFATAALFEVSELRPELSVAGLRVPAEASPHRNEVFVLWGVPMSSVYPDRVTSVSPVDRTDPELAEAAAALGLKL
jgi:hypothetical protein